MEETPKIEESEPESATPRRRSRHESPIQTAREDTDLEKHISYVSGPDELDDFSPEAEDAQKPLTGLGLSGAGVQIESERLVADSDKNDSARLTEENMRSAERADELKNGRLQQETERSCNLNNLVYKRIQEENVKRHSTISANSGAIPVGIILPSLDTTPKTLKRQTKCLSLRGDTSSESKRDSGVSAGSERKLSHKKVRLPDRRTKLDDSPVFEPSIRQVSSPARIGPDASDMTALTYASMQDSPSARKVSKFPTEPNQKLRHLSYGDRLSKNMSVRRTSLEASPPMSNFVSQPNRITDTSVRRSGTWDGQKIMNNMAVKRSSSDAPKPIKRQEKPSNPVRGVIPSVVSETQEMSPSGGVRRFSREMRLENNDSVRRTSMDHATHSPPQTEASTRRLSQEKATLPSSPRKIIDPRYLQPTTHRSPRVNFPIARKPRSAKQAE